ncbi:hypothetical protein [Streptomyces griseosporeus]
MALLLLLLDNTLVDRDVVFRDAVTASCPSPHNVGTKPRRGA